MSKAEIVEEDIQSVVVLLTGPKAAGRSSLSKSILSDGKFDTKLRRCKFLTADTATWTQFPERYRLVTLEDLNRLRDQGQIVYEGEDKGLFGVTRQIALTLDDLRGGTFTYVHVYKYIIRIHYTIHTIISVPRVTYLCMKMYMSILM